MIRQWWTAQCDGCAETLSDGEPLWFCSVGQARAEAALYGWAIDDGRELCPLCAVGPAAPIPYQLTEVAAGVRS